MPKIRLIGATLGLGLALSACVSPAERVANKEDLLAAAGFTVRPVDSAERQTSMRALPPHKFVRQTRNGQVVYLYADPTVCNCLYLGDQQAYGTYRQEVFQKRIADEQQMTAQFQENSFYWGPWGPGWW